MYRRELEPERPTEGDLRDYFKTATEQRCLQDARMKRIAFLRLRSDPTKFVVQRTPVEIERDLVGSPYTFEETHDMGFRLDRRLPIMDDILLQQNVMKGKMKKTHFTGIAKTILD